MQACIITHVAFETAGVIESCLSKAGWTLRFIQAAQTDWTQIDPCSDDLWVVMGGPIGVYEIEAYPFLMHEIAAIKRRILANRPVLGVCLGA